VDTYIDDQDEVDNNLIEEIDDFLEHYPDDDSANRALEQVCSVSMAFLRPSPVAFLSWLSHYLKQQRDSRWQRSEINIFRRNIWRCSAWSRPLRAV